MTNKRSIKKIEKQKTQDLLVVTKEDQDDFREAVAIYCYRNNFRAKDIKATVDTILKILPIVSELNSKWEDLGSDNFDVAGVRAHRVLYDTMRNFINNKSWLTKWISEIVV